MVQLVRNGVFYRNSREFVEDVSGREADREAGRKRTMAYRIITEHNKSGNDQKLGLFFDAMASHDITFVNIVQTAKASGLEQFPVPYYLTNCHNSLGAVGGTINEDDHRFGLSAAIKYGGVYVPPHLAVIHSFMREMAAGCGNMILGSDSHTRYGALGAMGVGEGGGELVKQLLGQSYDMDYPRVIAVHVRGKPRPGAGPQDAALAIIGAVFKDGFAKNAVLEFVGDGIRDLPIDFRAGIDVMTTETTCWSSIWETDDEVKDFLTLHGRAACYKKLSPVNNAYYDGLIEVDLSKIKPMIALPFHPSNVYEIDEVLANARDIFAELEKNALETFENKNVSPRLGDHIEGKGKIRLDQGIIAGCAGGTFDNIMAAADILRRGAKAGAGNQGGFFSLSIYPGSQPVMLELTKNGAAADLIAGGAVLRTAFCGPCFGAGDVPANNGFSARHTTRNFPNREGSRPRDGQTASVALMDARSIAATALNGGYLISAESVGFEEKRVPYHYDKSPYAARIYNGIGRAESKAELAYGPNISDWPEIRSLGEHLLVKIVSFITDPVTTTDELIPSGETSSYRSNPVRLAEFTLSRKDGEYVGRAKAVRNAAQALHRPGTSMETMLPELAGVLKSIGALAGFENVTQKDIELGSAIFAKKPGDGSAREQAASCQRVLGGAANFANEYATKRYRSNLINWGIIPFTVEGTPRFKNGSYVFIPNIRKAFTGNKEYAEAWVIDPSPAFTAAAFNLKIPELNPVETGIILSGCLINYNRRKKAGAF